MLGRDYRNFDSRFGILFFYGFIVQLRSFEYFGGRIIILIDPLHLFC